QPSCLGGTPCTTAKGDRQTMKHILPSVGETSPNPDGRQDESTPVPHTQVHTLMRRTLESLQDFIAILLMLLLLVLSLQALWSLGRMALNGTATTTQLLSEVVFVLILMEVYRLMIF